MSYDFMMDIAERTAMPVRLPALPHFARRLRAIMRTVAPDQRTLYTLMFSIVSETLISATLASLPADRHLLPAVRAIAADHAQDEGRHHAYFRTLLVHLWSALDKETRSQIAARVPELIFAFLEPDLTATTFALADTGLDDKLIDQVIHESYPRAEVVADVAARQPSEWSGNGDRNTPHYAKQPYICARRIQRGPPAEIASLSSSWNVLIRR